MHLYQQPSKQEQQPERNKERAVMGNKIVIDYNNNNSHCPIIFIICTSKEDYTHCKVNVS
jgi:hypothetical protein